MLADAATAALFTLTANPTMLADAATAALFARTALPTMLADLAAAALFARTANPTMLADAAAAALFTLAALPPVLARKSSSHPFDSAILFGKVPLILDSLAGTRIVQHVAACRDGSNHTFISGEQWEQHHRKYSSHCYINFYCEVGLGIVKFCNISYPSLETPRSFDILTSPSIFLVMEKNRNISGNFI